MPSLETALPGSIAATLRSDCRHSPTTLASPGMDPSTGPSWKLQQGLQGNFQFSIGPHTTRQGDQSPPQLSTGNLTQQWLGFYPTPVCKPPSMSLHEECFSLLSSQEQEEKEDMNSL